MMKYLLGILFISSPLFANYLGADRADVEAGLRLYTEKQLSEMKRKERMPTLPVEQVEKPKEDEPSSKNWDEEISTMLQADTKQKPEPQEFSWVPPISVKEEIKVPEKPGWKQAGFQEFGKKEKKVDPGSLITIPSGSFIMADLLTGVDAPTQTSIPALIRTRVGFTSPNEGFVDLSGCHVIAQATGDLSTERVKFKTITLSCLSPENIPYEQPFTAYAAGEDDSFGVPGELVSRQGRVAMMAFLNGVLEGATKIVSQTSSTMVSPISALSSESSSSAAVEVVRWYLEHAKALVPTIEVKAGVPVRLILLEPLTVPKSFFKKFSPNKETNHDEADLVL